MIRRTYEGGCVCGGHGAYFEEALLADGGDGGGGEGTKEKTCATYHFGAFERIKFSL